MGIRFYCPNGHKLNVKDFQAGRKGICPYCGTKMQIPLESTRKSSKEEKAEQQLDQPPDSGEGQPVAPMPPTGPVAAVASGAAPATPVAATPAAAAPVQAQPAAVPVQAAQPLPAQPQPAQPQPPQPPSAAPPAVADPLAEAGEAVWYVRPASGGQFGPAGADVMRGWIEDGRVAADSLVWREGWGDWQEASEVFPQLGAGGSEPAAEGISAASPSATSTLRARHGRRRKSKATQTAAIVFLICAVIALSLVFAWVLFQ